MAKSKDEYVVTNVVKGNGYTAIVHRPILTDAERKLRYAIIEDALTDFVNEVKDLRGCEDDEQQETFAG